MTVPTLSISQADGNALISTGTSRVTIDPAQALPLTNTMVGTSSRGTTIGDPPCEARHRRTGRVALGRDRDGDEETNFGGTSGAAPVVSGPRPC